MPSQCRSSKSVPRANVTARLLLAGLLMAAASANGADVNQPAGSPGEPQPVKKISELGLKHDSFTFVRVKYSATRGNRSRWLTDFPDADLRFSERFAHVTGLKAHPNGQQLELTDPRLKEFPFIYLVEGGGLALTDADAKALREYLLGGGFLMVDDFWGEAEWESFAAEMAKVFPDRKPVELPIEHSVFHCFYNIAAKPQVPNAAIGELSQYRGVTWERHDAREVHYRGIQDDRGRLMAIFCHNTDLGDGWSEDGANRYFYREFSMKKAFPLGINIVLYALSQSRGR